MPQATARTLGLAIEVHARQAETLADESLRIPAPRLSVHTNPARSWTMYRATCWDRPETWTACRRVARYSHLRRAPGGSSPAPTRRGRRLPSSVDVWRQGIAQSTDILVAQVDLVGGAVQRKVDCVLRAAPVDVVHQRDFYPISHLASHPQAQCCPVRRTYRTGMTSECNPPPWDATIGA